jgi:hypothetical protein
VTVSANSLLALVGASTPVGYNAQGGEIICDHQNDRVFQRETGTLTGSAGIKQFAGGITGTETLQATETDIFGPGPAHTLVAGPGCYHTMGKLFCPVDAFLIGKIDATTLVADEIIGTSSGAPSTCDAVTGVVERLASTFQIIPATWNGHNFIVSRGNTAASRQREVAVINVDTVGSPLLLSAVNITEQDAALGTGPDGTFYVIGHNYLADQSTPITLYKYSIFGTSIAPADVYTLPNAAVSRATLRSILPSDIDPTWTQFETVNNPGYDQADGNIICTFSSPDPVTNKKYLAKLDGSTGATIWLTPITNAAYGSIADIWRSDINGKFAVWSKQQSGVGTTVNYYDTATGAFDAVLWNLGLEPFFSSQWSTTTGALSAAIASGYAQNSGPIPTYLGAYLAANSNVIPPHRFGRIYLGVTPPPVPILGATGYVRVWGLYR